MENLEECRVHTLSCDRHFRDRCRDAAEDVKRGEVGGGERLKNWGPWRSREERASRDQHTINAKGTEVRGDESVPGLWGPRP